MIKLQRKMTHRVVLITCWVLAVGRGSGLTGLPDNTYETTPTPQQPRRTVQSQYGFNSFKVQNHSVIKPSRLFSATVNLTDSLMGSKGEVELTKPTSITTSSPLIPFIVKLLPTKLGDVISTSSAPPRDHNTTPLNPSGPGVTVRPTNRVSSFPKEKTESVFLRPQKELFVRRKHDESVYKDSTKFALVEDHLKGNNTGNHSSISEHQIKHLSHVSETVKSAVKLFKSNIKTFRCTRRPQYSKTPAVTLRHNATKKAKTAVSGRKRPIVMGIPASSTVLLTQKTTSTPAPSVEAYNSQESDEYYSSYGDYMDGVSRDNVTGYQEGGLLPDPDITPDDGKAETEVVLPDDSLADTDLHDHDRIDSVMYIYFGSSGRDDHGAGRQVLVVGAVISLVAQSLTLISVLRRLHSHPSESASLILLNAELALTAGNLVFMLGVQATGSKTRCELVAVSLHYLHLATCAWLLVNSVFAYSGLQRTDQPRRLRLWWVAAWSVPAVVVLLCVVFNRRGYETRSFCWVSVARGMLYSFLAPIAVLILLNTCLAVLGLRQLSLSLKVEDSDRKAMRSSAILLPVFAIMWFLGVVALENSGSLVFPLMFVASGGFLNWFVLACWLPADMSLWRDSEEDYDDDDDDLYEEVLKSHPDSQPLLDELPVYVCGRRDECELQMDPISTISS